VGSVHTTGLDLSEGALNLESDRVVEPGLLVTIHPMTNIGEWRQLFVGETYIVGERGPEPLNHCSEEIAVIP
jgi:Xaa-Pro aminopeptidase